MTLILLTTEAKAFGSGASRLNSASIGVPAKTSGVMPAIIWVKPGRLPASLKLTEATTR